MSKIAYLANDNLLKLVGLKDRLTGNFANSATVTATVLDTDGAEVAGQTWPTAMSYVAGSDGDYQATIVAAVSLIAGQRYFARIAGSFSGSSFQTDFPFQASDRH